MHSSTSLCFHFPESELQTLKGIKSEPTGKSFLRSALCFGPAVTSFYVTAAFIILTTLNPIEVAWSVSYSRPSETIVHS